MHFDPPTCTFALAFLATLIGIGVELGRIRSYMELHAPIPARVEAAERELAIHGQRLDTTEERLRALSPLKGSTP